MFSKVLRDEKKEARPKQVDQGKLFVFCDKASGVAQFRAGSLGASESNLDRIAGLFAMQCLVRGYDPHDFVVLVPAEERVASELLSRATNLLEEGRAVTGPTTLSPRQREILHSVVCNHANKEIASKLNITVRTVKFHISSLLNKFGVDNRTELARRAAGVLRPTVLDAESAEPQGPGGFGSAGDDGLPRTSSTPGPTGLHIERRSEVAFSASGARQKSFGSWRAAR